MITIVIILAECLLIMIIMGRLTGRKIFDPSLSSGLIRLAAGVLFALVFYLANEACFRKWGHMCSGVDLLGIHIAALLAALVLIPAGILQTSYLLLKRLYSRVRVRGNTDHT